MIGNSEGEYPHALKGFAVAQIGPDVNLVIKAVAFTLFPRGILMLLKLVFKMLIEEREWIYTASKYVFKST